MSRRLLVTTVTSVAALLSVAPSAAQDVTTGGYINGERLITRCTSVDHLDGALCLAYILGVADSMQAAQASGGTLLFEWRTCPPPGTMAERLEDIVVRFLTAHPETQRSSASGLVAKALNDAFPCPPQ